MLLKFQAAYGNDDGTQTQAAANISDEFSQKLRNKFTAQRTSSDEVIIYARLS